MIKFCYVIIIIFSLQSCFKEKNHDLQSPVRTCGIKDISNVSSNGEGECQVLRLFDEICLNESSNTLTLNVFRIRYFTQNDSGCIYTIYNQNNCSILKFRKAQSSMFHLVIREYTGEGHSLNLRSHATFVSNNKFLSNGKINHLVEYSKGMQPYIDDGEIKDFVEILFNGEYRRYDCTKEQIDSILSQIRNLK